MILHIVSTSPFQNDALQRCLQIATSEDAILLTEDATLGLLNPAHFLTKNLPTFRLFALEPDLQARGITVPESLQVTAVDYDGFVTLTTQYAKTVSWF